MANPKDFHPGQTLWYVTKNHRHHDVGREVVVSSIGRKWVGLKDSWQDLRFDPETMMVDGGQYTSPGRIYLDQAEHVERLLESAT